MAELFCIGNPLIDVFAEAPRGFCKRFGLDGPVQHVPPERAAAILEALPKAVYRAGGGAANTAKTAAGLGIGAAFSGTVGKGGGPPDKACDQTDSHGAVFEAEMAQSGAKLYLVKKDSPTGVFISIKEGKERRIAASPGAALEYGPADIPEAQARKAKILVLDGYMLERKDLVRRFFELSDTAALDAGSVFMVRSRAAEIAGFFKRRPLFLFINEEEGTALYQSLQKAPERLYPAEALPQSGTIDPQELYRFLGALAASAPRSTLILKLAERGAAVFQKDRIITAETAALDPPDSTGAGDAFAAGFLAGVLRGQSPEECAALGNSTAGKFLVTHSGI